VGGFAASAGVKDSPGQVKVGSMSFLQWHSCCVLDIHDSR
jgi:hypothetical protein